jgi:hypothetical protein
MKKKETTTMEFGSHLKSRVSRRSFKFGAQMLAIGLFLLGCDKEETPNQQELTDEQIEQAYQEIKLSADSILLSDDPVAGFEKMAKEYRKMEEVKNVEAREDGLFVKFINDEIVGWYVPPKFDYAEMYKELQKSIGENNVLKSRSSVNKTVCLIDQQDGEDDLDDQNYREACLRVLESTFREKGWKVEKKIGPEVTLDFVANHLADYDAIYYIAHGIEYDGKTWIFTNTIDPDFNDWDILKGLFAEVYIKNDDGSGISLTAHYMFSGDFIKNSYAAGSFTGKCIYMVACQSMGSKGVLNLEMAKAFTDGYGGASAYIGWDEINKTGEGTGMYIFILLLDGYTLGDACVELAQNRADLMTNKKETMKKKYDAHLIYYPADAKDFRLVEPGVIPSDGLIAYYPFNGNANDISGNENHGELLGETKLTTDRKGHANSAYNFGGYYNSSAIKVTNSTSLQFADQFTISAWYKLDGLDGMNGYGSYSTNGTHCIIAKDGDRGGFWLYRHSIGINNSGSIGFGFSTDIPELPSAGEWTHIAAVVSPNSVEIFQNGQSITKNIYDNVTITEANNRDLYIGRFGIMGGWYPLYGDIDDIRIYNRALTGLDIQALYNE